MDDETRSYPRGPRNSVNRYRKRGSYDCAQIHKLINSTPVLHVSFTPDPEDAFPAILPMIGQMGLYSEPSTSISSQLDCYLHGYVSSRIMNLARSAVAEGEDGLPVCIAATKLDGLVLSLTPNSHSYNYRSAILHGYATIVEDEDEKLWAMQLVTDSVVPGRWEGTRTPPNATEMRTTNVLRVKIVDASCKIRAGPVSDDKKDLNDEAVTKRVWTGVVPVWEFYGEPAASEENKVKKVPAYIQDYLNKTNQESEKYARDTATST